MGTDKRERQKAGRAARLEAAREAERRARRRQNFILIGAFLVFALIVLGIGAWRGRSSDESASTSSTASTVPTSTTAAAGSLPSLPPGATITAETQCPPADGSAIRPTPFAQPPPMCIDPTKIYTAKVSTTKGDFTIVLDATRAPQTVNNFVVLSRYHYYDGVPFHRVVTGFVAQTGDPQGPPFGGGDPGYSIPDELPASVDEYKNGSVAMANSGPNTSGSQWFVWVGPNKLPTPAYSLFGQVTEGLDTTVPAIMAGGSAGSEGTPTDPTWVNYILIGENGTYPTAPTTTAPPPFTPATTAPLPPGVPAPGAPTSGGAPASVPGAAPGSAQIVDRGGSPPPG
jgi:cyclophilin family peptidyl-prolyl cis-trans isomerase